MIRRKAITLSPFTSYLWLAVAYTFLLSVLLLAPFDFRKPSRFEKNNLRWMGEINGIEFSSVSSIHSSSPPQRLHDALVSGSGLTLEIWAATETVQQGGPARIVSYSIDKAFRNFTLGQERENLIVRLRTVNTDLNGTKHALIVEDVFHSDVPQHIAVTYDFSEQNVYVNGKRRTRASIPSGSFSNWDPSYSLVLGNEATGSRPWLGELFLVAIYNRALSGEEIWKNYKAGRVVNSENGQSVGRVADGLVTLYLFNEGKGERVLDRSGLLPRINLEIPPEVWVTHERFLAGLYRQFNLLDAILNTILFIPLGFLLHAAMRSRYGSTLKIAVFIILFGTLFALTIESLQYFSPVRFSSMADLFSNMAGTVLGVAIDKSRTCLGRLCLGSQRAEECIGQGTEG
jgi:hypothetical protein